MIHKELKASGERIRRLTERVPKKLDKHLEVLQEPNDLVPGSLSVEEHELDVLS